MEYWDHTRANKFRNFVRTYGEGDDDVKAYICDRIGKLMNNYKSKQEAFYLPNILKLMYPQRVNAGSDREILEIENKIVANKEMMNEFVDIIQDGTVDVCPFDTHMFCFLR